MTKLPRVLHNVVFLAAGGLAWVSQAFALDASEWKYRQAIGLEHTGLTKLTLSPATIDACRSGLADLRLLDPDGRETPYLLDVAAPTTTLASRAPKSFRTSLGDASTEIIIETGTTDALTGVRLKTAGATFLKPAKVETSSDAEHWTVLRTGVPLFRQAGAEQLTVDLDGKSVGYVRLTIDDAHTPPVPFTGAALVMEPLVRPAPTLPLPLARISHRDEFAGETVLTLDLGAKNIPLASVHLSARDAIFARKVTVTVREARNDTVYERPLAIGTLFRLQVDGAPATSELDLPLAVTVGAREVLVHIQNGDSPPLQIDAVTVQQRPVWLVLNATSPGTYTLLTGNPDAAPAHYDLSPFAGTLRQATETTAPLGALTANPGYQRRDALADTPLLGGPLDPAAWSYRKPVTITEAGVQELELDLPVLAKGTDDLVDLRLVREGAQVPYLLERPELSRAVSLSAVALKDPKRPALSQWEIKLPGANLPFQRLVVSSPGTLFQRHLRLFERITREGDGSYERTLAEADWSQSPGRSHSLDLRLGARPATAMLVLETDNGDNPPLPLGKVEATYPVARLLFKSAATPLTLYYGNPQSTAPRYDIALVAAELFAADKHEATLGAEEGAQAGGWASHLLSGTPAGALFWGALAAVVIVLLVIVAKLLPKPPAA